MFSQAFFWWGRVDSNHRRHCQQIYSLSPLATREHPHIQLGLVGGAGRRTRTPDLLITNQLLYRLSYTSAITGDDYNTSFGAVCQDAFCFKANFFRRDGPAEKVCAFRSLAVAGDAAALVLARAVHPLDYPAVVLADGPAGHIGVYRGVGDAHLLLVGLALEEAGAGGLLDD